MRSKFFFFLLCFVVLMATNTYCQEVTYCGTPFTEDEPNPWLAQIAVEYSNSTENKVCGGSLLTNYLVATTMECFLSTIYNNSIINVTMSLGTNGTLKNPVSAHSELIYHLPEFNTSTSHLFSLSLVVVNFSVISTLNQQQPLCLLTTDTHIQEGLNITLWKGDKSEAHKVEVLDVDECKKLKEQFGLDDYTWEANSTLQTFWRPIDEQLFCIRSAENDTFSVCDAPLGTTAVQKDIYGRSYFAGVSVTGKELCEHLGNISLYANITYFQTLFGYSDNPGPEYYYEEEEFEDYIVILENDTYPLGKEISWPGEILIGHSDDYAVSEQIPRDNERSGLDDGFTQSGHVNSTGTGTGTGAETGTGAGAETGTGAGAETGTETESQVGSKTGNKTGAILI